MHLVDDPRKKSREITLSALYICLVRFALVNVIVDACNEIISFPYFKHDTTKKLSSKIEFLKRNYFFTINFNNKQY